MIATAELAAHTKTDERAQAPLTIDVFPPIF